MVHKVTIGEIVGVEIPLENGRSGGEPGYVKSPKSLCLCVVECSMCLLVIG